MVALVMLPGLDGTGQLFAEFVEAMGQGVEVIVARYPADKPLGYAGLELIAQSFLPLDQDYYLLGESFSGPIAIAIAAKQPSRMRGLILCCSFARNPLPQFAGLRNILGWLPLRALPVGLLSYFLMGRFATAVLRKALANALVRVAPAVLLRRARAVLMVDVSNALASIKAPVLLLRASEDRIVSPASAEFVAAQVKQAKIVDFAAPHFLLQLVPAAAAAVVVNFMGLGKPGSTFTEGGFRYQPKAPVTQ